MKIRPYKTYTQIGRVEFDTYKMRWYILCFVGATKIELVSVVFNKLMMIKR